MKARMTALFEGHRRHLLLNHPELYVARVHVLLVVVPVLTALGVMLGALQEVSLDALPDVQTHWAVGLVASLGFCAAWAVFVIRDARLLPPRRGWPALGVFGLYLGCCAALVLPALVENVAIARRASALDGSRLAESPEHLPDSYAVTRLYDEALRSELRAVEDGESRTVAANRLSRAAPRAARFLGQDSRSQLQGLVEEFRQGQGAGSLLLLATSELVETAEQNAHKLRKAHRFEDRDGPIWGYVMLAWLCVHLVVLARAQGSVRLLISAGALSAYCLAWVAALEALKAATDAKAAWVLLLHYIALLGAATLVGLRDARWRGFSWILTWVGLATPMAMFAVPIVLDLKGRDVLIKLEGTAVLYLLLFPLMQHWLVRARVLPEA